VNSTVLLTLYFYTRVHWIAKRLWITYELYVFVSLIIQLSEKLCCRIRFVFLPPRLSASCRALRKSAVILQNSVIQVYHKQWKMYDMMLQIITVFGDVRLCRWITVQYARCNVPQYFNIWHRCPESLWKHDTIRSIVTKHCPKYLEAHTINCLNKLLPRSTSCNTRRQHITDVFYRLCYVISP
jgi:hypothetical protein